VLVIYTDGVTEARTRLARSSRIAPDEDCALRTHDSVKELLSMILDEVQRFSGASQRMI